MTDGAGTERWSSRSFGSQLQHRIFYLLIRLGGRRAAYGLLYGVVAWYVLLRPDLSGRADPYLARRFPEHRGWRRLRDRYRISLAFGKVLVDRAVVGILGPTAMDVVLYGREELLALLAEGRGLILMNAHVGCWQVAMSALGFLKNPVNMLMQREEGDIDRHYFEHAGVESPYKIIDPRGFLGGTLEMLAVLKRGEVLCVMGDRLLGSDRSAVRVEFLGGTMEVPFSALKLASTTGAPVGVLLSAKTGPNSYELVLAGAIRVPEGLGRRPDGFAPSAQAFADLLTGYVESHPYQFFNFFDLWALAAPDPPGGAGKE